MKNIIMALFSAALIILCSKPAENTINLSASLKQNDELKENPLLMKPITVSIQPKDNTISTFYGNDIAYTYAKKHQDSNYPDNAILYQVTWKQKPDEVWYGANIPASFYSVEKISFKDSQSAYERYEGKPLRTVSHDKAANDARKEIILKQRMAVSP